MKKAIVLGAALCLAISASASEKIDTPNPNPNDGGLLDCSTAIVMTCGDQATTPDPGPGGNVDNTYGCTGLSYGDCGEQVYEVCLGSQANITVDMTYAHSDTNDLDLFLLGACDEANCIDSSTGVDGNEQVIGNALPAGTYYVVVDGWAGRCDGVGVHDLNVICDAPCSVAVEPTTWGAIKAQHQD